MLYGKIDEFKKKYNGNIFLVTENVRTKEQLKGKYKADVIIVDDDLNYKEGKMLTDCISNDKVIEVGRAYLSKIFLLSRYKYLVAGKTNGSMMALIVNKGKYEDNYVFDRPRLVHVVHSNLLYSVLRN